MFTLNSSGSFKNTEAFLLRASKVNISAIAASVAQEGVRALAAATPVDSKLAANSWDYEISTSNGGVTISWTNSDIETGFPVVIMLQHGYATGTGGYVRGRDFINPAILPIFNKISDKVWKAVTS